MPTTSPSGLMSMRHRFAGMLMIVSVNRMLVRHTMIMMMTMPAVLEVSDHPRDGQPGQERG